MSPHAEQARAHVDDALALVRAAEVVAREEAAWIDAEWPAVSQEWSP